VKSFLSRLPAKIGGGAALERAYASAGRDRERDPSPVRRHQPEGDAGHSKRRSVRRPSLPKKYPARYGLLLLRQKQRAQIAPRQLPVNASEALGLVDVAGNIPWPLWVDAQRPGTAVVAFLSISNNLGSGRLAFLDPRLQGA
jgi:hypothetical protein